MFAELHPMFNPLKSDLLHLSGQPNSQKGSAAKVKDGIISEAKFVGSISVDQYNLNCKKSSSKITNYFYDNEPIII
jgi:hypothetical protein